MKKVHSLRFLLVATTWLFITVTYKLQYFPRHEVLLDERVDGLLRLCDQQDLEPFQVAGEGFLVVVGLHPV